MVPTRRQAGRVPLPLTNYQDIGVVVSFQVNSLPFDSAKYGMAVVQLSVAEMK